MRLSKEVHGALGYLHMIHPASVAARAPPIVFYIDGTFLYKVVTAGNSHNNVSIDSSYHDYMSSWDIHYY